MREIKTAVITGATGMIGTALAQLLSTEGITVAACVRPGSEKAARLLDLDKLYTIDMDLEELGKEEAFDKIFHMVGKVDAFFHLGWAGTFGEARDDMFLQNQNIRCVLDASKLAKRLGCQVFVGAGSQAEYGRVTDGVSLSTDTPTFPENGYGIAKLAAGQMSRILCRELGICHIWMRILSIYGPWDTEKTMVMSAVDTWIRGGKPAFSKGEQLWDYLYVKDAARALYLAAVLGKDGSIYPLGSGQVRKLKSYIKQIRDAVEPSAELGLGEIPYRPGQVMYLCADISELTKDTGFRPDYTFEEGIKETVAWRRTVMQAAAKASGCEGAVQK